MNDRITELSNLASNEIADLFAIGFFDDRMVSDVAAINEKFAKLIINECADLFTSDTESMTRYTGTACREMIKHYFRVEE